MNNKPHTGTAGKVQRYLEKAVGQTVTITEIREALNLAKDNTSVDSKIDTMTKAGHVTVNRSVRPRRITVLPAIIGKPNAKPPKKSKPLTGLPATNQALSRRDTAPPQLQFDNFSAGATNAQPIDVATLMQQVIDINEQNKVLRQALYNIAEILTQANIIESN